MTNEEMVARIQSGDKTLIGQVWEQNQGMINKIAWSYTNSNNPPDEREGKKYPNPDVLQELYLAMIDAVDSYSPDKGCVFLTYYNHG